MTDRTESSAIHADCRHCNGTGRVSAEPVYQFGYRDWMSCWDCDGTGRALERVRVDLELLADALTTPSDTEAE